MAGGWGLWYAGDVSSSENHSRGVACPGPRPPGGPRLSWRLPLDQPGPAPATATGLLAGASPPPSSEKETRLPRGRAGPWGGSAGESGSGGAWAAEKETRLRGRSRSEGARTAEVRGVGGATAGDGKEKAGESAGYGSVGMEKLRRGGGGPGEGASGARRTRAERLSLPCTRLFTISRERTIVAGSDVTWARVAVAISSGTCRVGWGGGGVGTGRILPYARAVLNEKKKVFFSTVFPKKPAGTPCVGGAVGDWRLVAVGGGWRRLMVGDWWLMAVGSGWRLAAGDWWRLAVGGWWQLVVGGCWSLGAVPKGGPYQKKI